MKDRELTPDEVAAISLVHQTLSTVIANHNKLCPCCLCDARFFTNITPDESGKLIVCDVILQGDHVGKVTIESRAGNVRTGRGKSRRP